jgi:mono/diheme cytochrome c family protein
MKPVLATVLMVFLAGAATAQPGDWRSRWGMMGPGTMANMARHHRVMMYGVPTPYTTAHDSLPNSSEKLSRGATIFQANCASCHGSGGAGNGPAGEGLIPPPANLAWLAKMPMSKSDPYMLWTVSEGGQPVGSDMPAFKQTLSRTDIWAAISYIRAGFPQR